MRRTGDSCPAAAKRSDILKIKILARRHFLSRDVIIIDQIKSNMQTRCPHSTQKDSDEQKGIEAQDNFIRGFSKKTGYEFLSNFYASTVAYERALYPTVEHAYQASKSLNEETRKLIRSAQDPWAAKKLGRSVQIREGWHDERVNIMRKLISEKFENPFIRWRLKETSPRILLHENSWNDRFWGIVRGAGENNLGKILMEVREEIIRYDSLNV